MAPRPDWLLGPTFCFLAVNEGGVVPPLLMKLGEGSCEGEIRGEVENAGATTVEVVGEELNRPAAFLLGRREGMGCGDEKESGDGLWLGG